MSIEVREGILTEKQVLKTDRGDIYFDSGGIYLPPGKSVVVLERGRLVAFKSLEKRKYFLFSRPTKDIYLNVYKERSKASETPTSSSKLGILG